MDEASVGVGSRQRPLPAEWRLQGVVHHGAAYTESAPPQRAGRKARLAVSDRGTLGGLTQFVTQFGFTGSTTSL